MRHYLDHASTSPLRPEAWDAMARWKWAADPSRVHTEGRMARAALETARDQVAGLFGVRSRQVVLTASGTEAVNAAVWGAVGSRAGRIVHADVEHSAVAATSARHEVAKVAVSPTAALDLDQLDAVLRGGGIALVHCQWANHEVGTIQPVAEAVRLAHRYDALVHVDACAAAGQVPIGLSDLGADLVSVSAHKMGGPPGAGALILGRGIRVPALMAGGAQERGRRAGMENVGAAAGFGAVAELLAGSRLTQEEETARVSSQRIVDVVCSMDGVSVYGDRQNCLPHIVCLGVEGVEAEGILIGLDQAGIAAHSGSACSSEELEPSPVLAAMGVEADHSLRVSVGWSTTEGDIDALARSLPEVVSRLRALGAR